jgi:hypothetical protein
MTVLRVGKDGIPRDFFSGKIVDVEGLKSNLPKVEKRQYKSSPQELYKATKETAERALIIARHGL